MENTQWISRSSRNDSAEAAEKQSTGTADDVMPQSLPNEVGVRT